MRWHQYQTSVDATDFTQVVDALTTLLDRPANSLSEGIVDLLGSTGEDSIVKSTKQSFLAARWHADWHQELFFVNPASSEPQLGYSILLPDGAEPSIPTPLLFWLSPAASRPKRLPTFSALLSAYAARGADLHIITSRESLLEADLDYLQILVAEQSDQLRQLRADLREARRHKPSQATKAPLESVEAAADFDLAQWCLDRENEIVVLPRARNGAKKSRYEEPSLIPKALDILAGPYRALRRGEITQDEFNAQLNGSGLRLSGSVAPSIAGEQGDAYFVFWAGRRRFLEQHLLKGGGRDERYCFRLYFFWDADSERAVVGSMPSHLANSLS